MHVVFSYDDYYDFIDDGDYINDDYSVTDYRHNLLW